MRLGFGCLVIVTAMAGGCSIFDTTCAEDDRDCLGAGLFAKGVGGECERNGDCVEGLFCENAVCALNGDTPEGDSCRLTGECAGNNYCGVMPDCTPSLEDSCHRCLPAGDSGEGGDCTLPSDCEKGLACEPPDLATLDLTTLNSVAEVSGVCVKAGDREAGEPCESAADCHAGLSCVPDDDDDLVCQSIPLELPALPALWDGIECPEVAAGATPEAYFEVPRAGATEDEFYALPFPNDIRKSGGRIDLRDHPRAPDDFGLPFVARYMDLSSEDLEGFSTNPVIYFRFSHSFSFGSVTGETVRIVNITPDSPDYDAPASIEWRVTEGRLSNYVCPHFLAMRRPIGTPLRPGTTYAAIVTTGVVPQDGGSFARGGDFSAMLAPSAPSDSVLAKAYPAYQPLRDWIADTNQQATAILTAAVFTTQDPEAIIKKLRAKVDERPTPAVSSLLSCASGMKSPCEDATGRGACRGENPLFEEVHGKIKLPIYQQGTLPYLKPEDGGAIEIDAQGNVAVTDEMDVCFALSVPKAAPPAGGYPVLVYGHGTGGSFNGQMSSGGIAEEMASASTPIAVISIDLPMHGDRRGGSEEEPDNLFFNFLNPRAGRDNALQGAADLMSVVRWVQAGGFSAGQSPTGSAVPLSGSQVGLFGHSQGATHTALMASYAPTGVVAVVLSGVGGHLATSLMTKTSPVDITVAVPFALLDPDDSFDLAADSYNPALAIVQGFFDRVDPINYANRLWREPTTQQPTGFDTFITYGIGDTFSPNETTDAYLRAGRITHVEPVRNDVMLDTAPSPLLSNVLVGGTPRTIGMRQYEPTGDLDGHFVATDKGQEGHTDAVRFLSQALAVPPIAPQIGQ
jgi:pimeloyl-ACP methyl ester carboxylesterase